MLRRFLTAALVGVLASLPTLAHTDPPDPTWVGGFWDNDDYDDVITQITTTSAVADMNLLRAGEAQRTLLCTVPLVKGTAAPEPARSPHRPRGPPLA